MDRIGRYLVVERLGSGAFGTVYRADDPILEMAVAIKVLADAVADDPEMRHRFINEARVMRKVKSARIATIYDIAELPDGRPYFVMQLADRGTLDQRLQEVRRRQTPIPVTDLLAVVHGLGDALAVIHDAGIVHRDVKPSNLLIDVAPTGAPPDQHGHGALVGRDECLMLADFGIAKNLEDTRRVTAIAGTAAYMAPEQRIPGAPIGGRADIYAASAILAELLDTTVVSGSAPTVPSLPGPRPAVHAALSHGLATDPNARYGDARTWTTALSTAITGPTATPTPPPTLREPPWPGPPGWYGPPQPPSGWGPPPARTNGFAVTSLVLGIVALFPLAAIFGVAALRQIKRRGDGGRGMAIAGLILAGFWFVMFLISAIRGDLTDPPRDNAAGHLCPLTSQVADCSATGSPATQR